MLPNEVVSSWSTVSALLQKCIEFCHGDFEVDDIKVMVEDRSAFILALSKGKETVLAAACQVIVLPRRKVLNVIAVGGKDLDVLYLHFWDELKGIARTLDVDAVRGAVRPAMELYCKHLASDDFTRYAILEKRL